MNIEFQHNICKHFGICGGCDFQNVEYTNQLHNKYTLLQSCFKDFEIQNFNFPVASPDIWFYRNKMEFAVGGTTQNPLIGLRQKGKFYKIVDLSECKIFYPNIKEIFLIIKQWIKDNNIQPYDIVQHTGKLRYIVIRHSKHYDELMLNLVITGTKYQFEHNEKPIFESLVKSLKEIKNVVSLYVCINNKVSDNALTEEIFLLEGEKFIKEKVNDIIYKIYPTNFMQTNTSCCSVLYQIVKSEVNEGNVLDIYCGSGGVSLQIYSIADKVLGIDSSKDNIIVALENQQINNIQNVEFIESTAEMFLSKLWKSKFITNLSTIIVDPPRAGLSKKVKSVISEMPVNKIIYVSCNYESLKEDLKTFLKFYKITKIIPIDMFPHTRHIEVVSVLEHR